MSEKTNRTLPFNSKLFMVKLSKHFYQQIIRVEEKLNSIRKYFVFTTESGCQTKETGSYVSLETINKLKEQIISCEVENKQLTIYKSSVDQQLSESRNRVKFLE